MRPDVMEDLKNEIAKIMELIRSIGKDKEKAYLLKPRIEKHCYLALIHAKQSSLIQQVSELISLIEAYIQDPEDQIAKKSIEGLALKIEEGISIL